jgi:uncharacterized protein (TIGR02453 family)
VRFTTGWPASVRGAPEQSASSSTDLQTASMHRKGRSLKAKGWHPAACRTNLPEGPGVEPRPFFRPGVRAGRGHEAVMEVPEEMASYFDDDLFRFLEQLKRHNNREWFQRHKADYEAHVHQPALRFIAAFADPLYGISPRLIAGPRSLFRIHRDTRFSPDKRPYKTHVGMRFSHPGKDVHSPGYYLHLEPGGCFAAAGLWRPDQPTLLKVRNAIVERPKAWRAVRGLVNWDDSGRLTRPPRGFPADHEFVEDLKLKDIGSAIGFTDRQICGPRFMTLMTGACRRMAPLARFLSEALDLPF